MNGQRQMIEVYVPHIGWLEYDDQDDVAKFLSHGWFEYQEQAFLWLYLRPGDQFLDCGAHVGLFSVLASRTTNGDVHILAIEPNPPTLPHLRNNLDSCEAKSIEVIAGAAFSESGKANLSVGNVGKSAYSSVAIEVSDNAVLVDTITIDELLESRGIEVVDFMKLDVEGAETAVLHGALRSVKAGRLPVVMVEFTESTLNELGMSTRDLKSVWEKAGYSFFRFDEESLRLTPYDFDGPIVYENLFAVMDLDGANRRLDSANKNQRRIAKEIINRCGTAKRHFDQVVAAAVAARNSLTESREALAELRESYNALANSRRVRIINKLFAPWDWFRLRRH